MRQPAGPPRAEGGTALGASGDAAATPSDLDLWSALRAADPEALTALFDRHASAVHTFAFRRAASWSSAEDVTQATFLTTWRRTAARDLPVLDHPTAVPWLLGVADHESRSLYRSALRRRRLQQRLDTVRDTGTDASDHAGDVAGRLDDERRMARVREAVRVLPTHQRVVVELVVWSGLSLAEAASALGVAEGTVKSRLSRAKSRLGERLSTPTSSEEAR